MGSIEYFVPKLGKEVKVELTPDILKYIVTCMHPEYSPYASCLKNLKEKFQKAIEMNESLKTTAYGLRPYPTLVKKIIFEKIDVLNYFESMGKEGHNYTLINELGRITKANPEIKNKKSFQELVEHVYNCTVQLAKLEDRKIIVWSPVGLREGEIDTTYLGKFEEGFFTTHGINEIGERYGIRFIRDKRIIDGLKNLEKLWRKFWEESEI